MKILLRRILQKQDIAGINGNIPPSQISFLGTIKPFLILHDPDPSTLLTDALDFALRLLVSINALLMKGISQAIDYDENHPDISMSGHHMDKYAERWLMDSLLWSFSGSASWSLRAKNFLTYSSEIVGFSYRLLEQMYLTIEYGLMMG